MFVNRYRAVAATITLYGVGLPALASGISFFVSTHVEPRFGTVLFGVFVVAATITGIAGMNNPSAPAEIHAKRHTDVTETVGDQWTDSVLVKLLLIDIGLAGMLTLHSYVVTNAI